MNVHAKHLLDSIDERLGEACVLFMAGGIFTNASDASTVVRVLLKYAVKVGKVAGFSAGRMVFMLSEIWTSMEDEKK